MKNWIQKIGIGTVQFGLDYGIANERGKVPINEVAEILKVAQHFGISLLDTARAYGESEQVLGQVLKMEKASFQIVSKMAAQSISPKKDVETSLLALGCQKLYGYLLHDFNDFEKNPALWKEMQDLKVANQVEKVGFSLYYPSQLIQLFEQNLSFDLLQVPYNLFDRRFEPYFEQLKVQGVEIHVRSVFLQGLFLMPLEKISPHFAPIREKLATLAALTKEAGISKAAIPLWFALQNPHLNKVLLGLSGIADLKQNLALIETFDAHKTWFQNLHLNSLQEDNEDIILPFRWKT
ncbi:aldo/keto reductase [Hugenholtzia roseola]|uniref:aldo/keto reductase n=1 Tax=Hugenholtzia roseola TaxID=1002 RepID=UPI000415CB37|nr:aldo/keto reductase [Hugenholtzia roseola]